MRAEIVDRSKAPTLKIMREMARSELVVLRALLLEDLAAILGQIHSATAEMKVSGVKSDPVWWAKVQSARRSKQAAITLVEAELGRRPKKVVP